jgi:myo-inositol-1(or 4)-monophosphatase
MDIYLQAAISAAKKSGRLFKKSFGNAGVVSRKNDDIRDSVTSVDLAIEKQLRKELSKAFPKAKIIGEEMGSAKVLREDWVWIIDPIDGTNNYIQGIPACCISIALWHKGETIASVIYNPISDQLFSASKGKGAFLNGKRVKVSNIKTISLGLGGLGWSLDIPLAISMFKEMMTKARKVRALGSSALQLAYVSAGIYDYYVVNHMHIWDVAAGLLLITEAGGKVTDWQGKKPGLEIKELVASNGKMHQEILGQLKKLS